MFSTEGPAEYLERAAMHEQLAAATDDTAARKVHLAMAAEYKRKAAELGATRMVPPMGSDPALKIDIAAR